ncbi:MAG: polysaccharide deacetylase family protein [Candidatus Moranbacteria bacterium]|nr:polysaccharide deacetylase family protein [Candidatus Moranbacteria bacterium]
MNTKICARLLVVSLLFQFVIMPAGVFAVPVDSDTDPTTPAAAIVAEVVSSAEPEMSSIISSDLNADPTSEFVHDSVVQSPAAVTESTVPTTPAIDTLPTPPSSVQAASLDVSGTDPLSTETIATPIAPVRDDATPTDEKTVTASETTAIAAAEEQTTNLIQNPSLETANGSLPANWSQEKYGTHSAIFAYPVAGHTGDKAAQITMASYKSGDAKWVFDKVAVTPGAEYVFSDWYQSTAKTLVVAQYTTSTGATQYVQLGSLAASTAWKQYSKTFTVPTGVTTMTVLHLIKANGTLTVDDYSLTTSSTTPTPAPTLALSANPTSIVSGSSSTLTWSSTDATSCAADWTSSAATSGTTSVSPTATTTYSMTCTGAGGTVTKTATVTVTTPNPVPTLTLSANPASIVSGSSSTLTWSATDATSCSAGWTSSTAISGTASVTPSATTTYSMTCAGAGGTATKTATVTVTTVPVPTENLIQNPSLETANGSLPANWAKNNWGTLTATYVYPVGGHTGDKAAQITVSGYKNGDAKWYFDDVPVTPGAEYVFSDWYQSSVPTTVTARYKMSAGGYQYPNLGTAPAATSWTQFSKKFTVPAGVSSMSVFHLIKANGTLTVDDYSLTTSSTTPTPAPTLTLSASPTSIVSGSSSTLTWSATDATSCSAGWTSSTATSGSALVTPTSTATYSMTCTGAGGTATKTATVTVTTPNPVPTLTLSANPTSIVSGSSSALTWSTTDATTCSATGGWTSLTATSGSVSVTPTSTTTYSMTCTGAGGSVTKTATVTVTTVPVPTENLIQNPSLETANGSLPANWAKNNWGTLTATYAYPVAGHTGDKAVQITVSGYKNGDAKWYFDDVAVTPGAEYVFSDWSKSAVQSTVIARFKTSTGALQYVEFGTVTGTGAWTQYSKSFTVPAGIVSMTILHVIKANGALAIDDASLTRNEAVFSEGMVSFTFDDGFLNTYAVGLPILDAAGIKSTQAIITGSLGATNYVSTAQVLDMAARGHEIASHTRTHANLPTLSAAALESEVAGSKADLVAIGITANSIVYPYGTYNDAVIAAVKNAGYTGARSVDDGYNTPMTGKYVVRDQHITSDVTFDTVKTWIDMAIANKQWLVLEMHQQSATGGTYSNDPALLQSIVDYVKQQNMKTVTLGQGTAMLQ